MVYFLATFSSSVQSIPWSPTNDILDSFPYELTHHKLSCTAFTIVHWNDVHSRIRWLAQGRCWLSAVISNLHSVATVWLVLMVLEWLLCSMCTCLSELVNCLFDFFHFIELKHFKIYSLFLGFSYNHTVAPWRPNWLFFFTWVVALLIGTLLIRLLYVQLNIVY